jgi:hypothetical protein
MKVTAVESSVVIGKKKHEALVGWKQSTKRLSANKGMLRIAIPRAVLGMASPFYAQKSPLHGNRKCRR